MTIYRQTMADTLEFMYLMREYKLMERELTDAELKRREEIAKDMDDTDFKDRYGDRWKEVKMAVATKAAKGEKMEGFGLDEAKPEYEVKYAKSKRGPVKVTKFMTLDQAKKFLADVKKDGMNGIISKAGKPVKFDEGYEKTVLLALKDDGIGGYFSKDILYVAQRKIEDAKAAIKAARHIKVVPKIMGEEVDFDEARQLKNPKKEVLVVKSGKVMVIDKKDAKEYLNKGWELAEELELDEMQYSNWFSVKYTRLGSGMSGKLNINAKDEKHAKEIAFKKHKVKPNEIKKVQKEEVELDEVNYKIKNGKVHISKKDYAKVSKDYKGKDTMTVLDPKTGATVNMPVIFEEDEVDEHKGKKKHKHPHIMTRDGELAEDNMDLMRKAAKGAMQTLKMKDGKLKMDSFTASGIMQVYDGVNPKNKIAMERMINDGKKAQIVKLQSLAMKASKGGRRREETELDERITRDQTYFKTYSDAVAHALEYTKSRGYEVDEDDFHNKVTTGPRKPSEGKTVSQRIDVTKGGKPVKNKHLSFQVYNKGGKNPYELNVYVEKVEVDEALDWQYPPGVKLGTRKELEKLEKSLRIAKKKKDKKKADALQKELIALMKSKKFGIKIGPSWMHKKEETELDEALKPGAKIKVPHKGKLRDGKVVRYVPQRGAASPYYVVDVGEYQSIEVPAHKIKEEVDLDEALQAIVWKTKPPKGTRRVHPRSKWPGMKPDDIAKTWPSGKAGVEEVDLDEARKSQGMFVVLEKGSKNKVIGQFKDKQKAIDMMKKNPKSKVIQIGKFATTDDKPVDIKVGDELSYTRVKLATKVKEEVDLDEGNLNNYVTKFKQKLGKTTYQTMTDWVDGIGGLTKREASTLKLKLKPFTEEIKLDEGRMSDLHLLIKQGKSAEEIAKIMKVDVKTIKALMDDFRESARSDALRAMRKDKDLGPRGHWDEPDTYATDADIKGASKNIIMQMRKVVSLNGRFAVEFEDRKKVKIPVNIAVAVQQKFDSFRKSRDKAKFSEKIAKSYKSMLTALKENTILDRIGKKIQERKNG